MANSKLTVKSIRKSLMEAGFDVLVRRMSDVGYVQGTDILCAALFCSRRERHQLYVNTQMDCDHAHLTKDVVDLIEAFDKGQLDRGWTQKPDGDASTGICTRSAAARAGIDPSNWAPGPNRKSS
jgi:hypothetical protein